MRVAVIGAGMAGLAAAGSLSREGADVHVWDKGRGVGGRLSTRRREQGAFDHGAQRFNARDESFRAQVASWQARGWVAETERASAEPWWLPVPSANSLPKSLAAGLTITSGVRVMGLRRQHKRWQLALEGAQDERLYDVVLCTAPAPQAAALFAPHAMFQRELAQVRYEPTWAVMLGCDRAQLAWPEPIFSEGGADASISLLVREGRKPGRAVDESLVRLTLHASTAFSETHLERSEADVTELLVAALRAEFAFAREARVRFSTAQRWRFARVATALGQPCLYDAERGLGVASDGLLGPRIEAAWLSGQALARAVLSGARV